MRKGNFIPFALVLLLAGCSSTMYIGTPDRLQREIGNKSGHLALRSGWLYEVDSVRVRPDSTLLFDAGTHMPFHLPTSDILYFESTDHFGGALSGLFVGVCAGGLTGALLGVATMGSSTLLGPTVIVMELVALGVIGGLGGTIYGVLHGNREMYIYEPDSPNTAGSDRRGP
jgi:hypothetical protein